MVYNADDEREIAATTFPGDNNTTIELKLVSYRDGPVKLQISRFTFVAADIDTRSYLKLRRLTMEEARGLFKALAGLLEGR